MNKPIGLIGESDAADVALLSGDSIDPLCIFAAELVPNHLALFTRRYDSSERRIYSAAVIVIKAWYSSLTSVRRTRRSDNFRSASYESSTISFYFRSWSSALFSANFSLENFLASGFASNQAKRKAKVE